MKISLNKLITNFNEKSKSNKNSNRLIKFNKNNTPVVSEKSNGKFKILSGTEQVLKAKERGEKIIKCNLFENLSEQEKFEFKIQNSYQMPQVNALKLGNLLVNYRSKFKITQQELARKTGITAGTIHHYESLITTLATDLTEHVNNGNLTFKEARSIADIDDPKRQIEIAQPFIDGKLSSVYVEKIVSMAKSNIDLNIETIIDSVINGKPIEKPIKEIPLVPPVRNTKSDIVLIESKILALSAEIASLQMKNIPEFKRLKLISSLRILESRVKLTLSFLNSGPTVNFNLPVTLSDSPLRNSVKTKKP